MYKDSASNSPDQILTTQERKAEHYQANKAVLQARARARYRANRAAILRQQRGYYSANRDVIRLADKVGISRPAARQLLTEEQTHGPTADQA